MANVLIVDDSVVIQTELKKAVEECGHSVLVAGDGLEALNVLAQYADVKLMFCDFNMPNMGGIDLIKAVRKNPDFNDLTVIVISTETSSNLKQTCKELKISGWILKPYNVQNVQSVVKKLVD